MADDLKPCPFCGPGPAVNLVMQHNPEGGWLYEVICQGCSTTMPCDDSETDAISDWNRRASSHAQCDSAKRRASKRLFGNAAWLDRPDMSDQMDDPFSDDDGSRCRMITPNELIAEIEAADRLIPAEGEEPNIPVMSMALNKDHLHQLTREQLANAIAVIAHLRSQVTEAHRLLREARRFVDDDPCKLTSSALTRQISAALSSTERQDG